MEKKYHDLKTHVEYFQEVRAGRKTFEIRKNDRDFKTGDILILWEYNHINNELTGKTVIAEVTYMTDFGQKENYVVLAIKIIE